ncbi:hypothetical protein EVAR_25285_1 [Eumeta japonica]|uniref:Uncharacterized protein n=1 Tax=Eumeta variegata TaxID=151549 RepID=A0A4C1VP32_EUMVA|nr:hypothetical protein EVAR_25285_1 [Eumeta japonica]
MTSHALGFVRELSACLRLINSIAFIVRTSQLRRRAPSATSTPAFAQTKFSMKTSSLIKTGRRTITPPLICVCAASRSRTSSSIKALAHNGLRSEFETTFTHHFNG